jgi:uncharacterized DUF497 family protein
MSDTFEWDPRKAETNARKHGVTFEEAVTVFADPLAVAYQDETRGERTLLLGLSARLRVIMVVHVEVEDEVIRLVSARRATRHERRRYEEGT